MGVPMPRTPMPSSFYLLLVAVILAIFAYLKLKKYNNQTTFHNFDVNATLPLRGLLAILIVCHHIGQRFADTPIGIFVSFGMTLVSVFFFVSGYGLMISYQKKGRAYLSNFFKHRLSKLLPVFLTLTLACIACSCIFEHRQLSEVMHDLLRGKTPLPNSWFMYAIIYQYIAFYIACKMSRTKMQCIVVAAILTLLSMLGLYKAHFGDYWIVSQPAFVLGMLIASYENIFREILAKHTLATLASVLIAMAIGIINGTFMLIHGFIAFFLSFIFPNLMPILVISMIYSYGSTNNKVAHYLGKISLEIYLIQGLAIMNVEHFNLPWYAFAICVFAITIPAAEIAHRLGSKVSSRF
jgi:peptidoglycan/LPS O-acetylase OafA/YrhL